MLKHTCIDLGQLSNDGKDFKWDLPISCPHCSHKLWGHGYVGRYFDGYLKKLYLKRLRCPHCKVVITMMPSGFIARYQASFFKICLALYHRLTSLRWPSWLSRQRGGHWLRKLIIYCKAHEGIQPDALCLEKKVFIFFESKTIFLAN